MRPPSKAVKLPFLRYSAGMSDNRTRLAILLLAILAAAMMRLIPHPPNFTPIGAMALFGGAYLGRRWLAFAAPLGALLLSDLVLGFYSGMAFVYAATALAVLLGWALQARRSPVRVVGAALASAVLFFLVTNFGMWLFSGFYPLTAAGLAACFVAALPFFQNSLAGDLVFCGLLFGGWALAERVLPALREPRLANA
jgi:hypothetical protein